MVKIKPRVPGIKSKLRIKKSKSQILGRFGRKYMIVPKCTEKCYRAPENLCLTEDPIILDQIDKARLRCWSLLMIFDIRLADFEDFSLKKKCLMGVLIAINLVILTDYIWERLFPQPELTMFDHFQNWLYN